jgi:methionine synthase I (cobalamin-dependent)
MSEFLDALRSGRVLLMDGAMGTELQRAGLKPGENGAAWNIFHPERVRAVHDAYRSAGAEVFLTNTFMIHAPSFDSCGWQAQPRSPWRSALELPGRKARFRLVSLGPVTDNSGDEFGSLKDYHIPGTACGDSTPHDCWHMPDAFLLETCSSPRVRFAIRYVAPYRPALLSLTYLRNPAGDLVTFSGHSPEWFARRAKQYGVAALGVNCGRDISVSDCAEIVRRYRRVTDLPLFARPNAGTPKKVRGRWVYPLTPQEMADRLPELLDAGVSMVGGCCGTTPEHIAALRPVVARWNRRR